MTMSSDQLGDMSDLLSAIQSDIQSSSKHDDGSAPPAAPAAEQSVLKQPAMEVESAFEPAVARREVHDDGQADLLEVAHEGAVDPAIPVEDRLVRPEYAEEAFTEEEMPLDEVLHEEGPDQEAAQQEVAQQEVARQDVVEPEIVEPEIVEPEIVEPEIVEPEWVQSGVEQSGVHQSGVEQSGVHQSGVHQSEVHQSGAEQFGAEQSGAETSEFMSQAMLQQESVLQEGPVAPAAEPLGAAAAVHVPADVQQGDPTLTQAADPIAAAPSVAAVDPALSLMVPSDAVAFAIDADSRAVITSLFGAGSEERVLEGDINATIEYLSQNTCPSMIIVDLSSSVDPMSELDGLADVCTPGTVVLALGATNDIGLYRRLRSAGIADYVVKPLNAEALAEAIRSSTEPQLAAGSSGVVQGKLICVIGARGGVGATTIATNCASLIAEEAGKKVGLIDFDLQFGTVALTLDMEASSGLSEAIENPSRVDATFIESVSVRVGDRLSVIASEDNIDEHVGATAENVAEFLNHLRDEFEVVVVDLPRHSAARWMRALGNVSKLMIVTDLSLSGLRDTGRLVGLAKDVVEPSRIQMIANRVGGDKYGGIDQAEFESAIERKFDFVVIDDSKAAGTAARAGKPVVQVSKDGKLAGNIREICNSLVKTSARAADPKPKKKTKFKLPFVGGKEE